MHGRGVQSEMTFVLNQTWGVIKVLVTFANNDKNLHAKFKAFKKPFVPGRNIIIHRCSFCLSVFLILPHCSAKFFVFRIIIFYLRRCKIILNLARNPVRTEELLRRHITFLHNCSICWHLFRESPIDLETFCRLKSLIC